MGAGGVAVSKVVVCFKYVVCAYADVGAGGVW
jgi:hypothetical protein